MKCCLLFSLFFSINSYSQSKVSGTVTYLYNDYQGNKADVGASIYIIDSAAAGNWFNPIDSFCKGYTYYQLLTGYQNRKSESNAIMNGPGMWIVSKKTKKKYLQNNTIPQDIIDGAKKTSVDTYGKFHILDSLCFTAIVPFKLSLNTYKSKSRWQ